MSNAKAVIWPDTTPQKVIRLVLAAVLIGMVCYVDYIVFDLTWRTDRGENPFVVSQTIMESLAGVTVFLIVVLCNRWRLITSAYLVYLSYSFIGMINIWRSGGFSVLRNGCLACTEMQVEFVGSASIYWAATLLVTVAWACGGRAERRDFWPLYGLWLFPIYAFVLMFLSLGNG